MSLKQTLCNNLYSSRQDIIQEMVLWETEDYNILAKSLSDLNQYYKSWLIEKVGLIGREKYASFFKMKQNDIQRIRETIQRNMACSPSRDLFTLLSHKAPNLSIRQLRSLCQLIGRVDMVNYMNHITGEYWFKLSYLFCRIYSKLFKYYSECVFS